MKNHIVKAQLKGNLNTHNAKPDDGEGARLGAHAATEGLHHRHLCSSRSQACPLKVKVLDLINDSFPVATPPHIYSSDEMVLQFPKTWALDFK